MEVEYFIPDYFFTGGFDVSTDKIAEALQGEKPVQEMIDGMKDLIKQYKKGNTGNKGNRQRCNAVCVARNVAPLLPFLFL